MFFNMKKKPNHHHGAFYRFAALKLNKPKNTTGAISTGWRNLFRKTRKKYSLLKEKYDNITDESS